MEGSEAKSGRVPRFDWRSAVLTGLALALIAALAYLSTAALDRSRTAAEHLAHSHEVVGCLNSARAHISRTLSSQRGYLLTGDAGFLQERDRSALQIQSDLRQCSDLTKDNTAQQLRLQEVARRVEVRLASYEAQQRLYAAAATDPKLVQEVLRGKVSVESIYALFDEMLAEEQRLLRDRQRADGEQAQQQRNLLLAVIALPVPMLALQFAVLSRRRRISGQLLDEIDVLRSQSGTALRNMPAQVLNAVPSPMLMINADGNIEFANSELCALLGYTQDELSGKPVEMLVPLELRHQHQAHRAGYMENATERAMGSGRELFGLRSDGEKVPLEIGLKPLTLGGSRFVLASVIDISGRRREAERLRLVIEAAPNAMLMVNAQGLITLVNMQFEQLFGYHRDEILGHPVEVLLPMRFRQAHAGLRQRFFAQPGARPMGAGQELFGLRRDGTEVPIEIGLNPLHTPDGHFVLASVVDISERKRLLERELLRASEELAGRFEQTRAAALTLFTSEFDEQRVLTGTLELLAERHPFPVALYYRADEAQLLHLAASRGAPANVAREIPVGTGLVGAAAQSGHTLYVDQVEPGTMVIQAGFAEISPRAMLFCPVSYRGQLLGVLALGASSRLGEGDRNAVERLVAQLGAALHNIKQYANLQVLAQELRERGEEVLLKNNQLEAANRMKSEFLANMSHELRTPLNAIIGFAEVMRDGLVGELAPQQRDCIVDIFESGQHLLALINDILDLSKIEAGRADVELSTESPVALLESGLAIVREKAIVQRVRLQSNWSAAMEPIELDVRKVKQIVFNLLSNAVKFTGEGGEVGVGLERRSRALVQQLLAQAQGRVFAPAEHAFEEYLEIRVSDTGIGIAAEDLARLFEPFTQVDSALSRKHTGTGLGLAMVRRLVELLEGSMAVSSAPGSGSVFTVWLPWIEPAPLLVPDLVSTSRQPAISPLVLVIEDRAQDAQLLRMLLLEAGFRVAIAPTAEAALLMIADEKPDAIVLDIILPGMDGWELLAHLKERAEFSGIPVVIVSVTDEAQRGIVLGAANVLVKPVSQSDLIAALNDAGVLPGSPPRVLVIDDDVRTVNLLTSQMEAVGLQVFSAQSGEQGVQLAGQVLPDLIVVDLVMPGMSGFEVISLLRADARLASIPILVLTAHSMTGEQRAELRGKVLEVIEKSEFRVAELIAEIRRAVRLI